MADVDPLTESWPAATAEVLQQMRRWMVGVDELNRHLGRWLGVSGTEAAVLGDVVWAAETDEPLSPAHVARHSGLSSGATSALLDRLEVAGHLVRSRESQDRRRVTLRPTAAARDRVRAFLSFAGEEVAAVLRTATATEVRTTQDFVGRLTEAGAEANRRLDAERSRGLVADPV